MREEKKKNFGIEIDALQIEKQYVSLKHEKN